MSKAHLPPVPPANRSNKGPGAHGRDAGSEEGDPGERKSRAAEIGAADRNDARQGDSANIAQNTRSQGYQQDR